MSGGPRVRPRADESPTAADAAARYAVAAGAAAPAGGAAAPAVPGSLPSIVEDPTTSLDCGSERVKYLSYAKVRPPLPE